MGVAWMALAAKDGTWWGRSGGRAVTKKVLIVAQRQMTTARTEMVEIQDMRNVWNLEAF